MDNPVVLVIGAGPGVSGSVARRYGSEGYDAALVGLDPDALGALGEELQADGVTAGWSAADVTDPASLTEAVGRLAAERGRVDVLHFNPSAYREADPLELTVPDLLQDITLGVGALLTAVQAAYPHMSAGGRITATGSVAADTPSPSVASLGIQKAALRNLVRSLDGRLAAEGIRAVSVTVHGVLDRHDPASPFHPNQVADALYAAARQDEAAWQAELPHPLTAG